MAEYEPRPIGDSVATNHRRAGEVPMLQTPNLSRVSQKLRAKLHKYINYSSFCRLTSKNISNEFKCSSEDMKCCVVLCCAVLCCVVLCCVMFVHVMFGYC
jgi:hypothetical protein